MFEYATVLDLFFLRDSEKKVHNLKGMFKVIYSKLRLRTGYPHLYFVQNALHSAPFFVFHLFACFSYPWVAHLLGQGYAVVMTLYICNFFIAQFP